MDMNQQAYPLAWPVGWPRTDPNKREQARFKVTLFGSLDGLKRELELLGAKDLVLSSNVTLGATNPADPGVAAYFNYQDAPACIPCDRWKRVEDNVHAIAKTIDAMRGIERWGAKHMVRAAFRGFTALSPPKDMKPWREVLGHDIRNREELEDRFKLMRSKSHPDKGGDAEKFSAVTRAYESAKQEIFK